MERKQFSFVRNRGASALAASMCGVLGLVAACGSSGGAGESDDRPTPSDGGSRPPIPDPAPASPDPDVPDARPAGGDAGGADVDASTEPDPDAPCDIPVASKGFLGRQTVVVNGDPRTYELFISEDYDGTTKLPLLFVMHGDAMDGKWVRSWFDFEHGQSFVVVYPDAHVSWDIETDAAQNQDLAFVDALLADVKTKVCIDRKRVFAFGNSNGGYFVNNLGCFRSAIFRGIVGISGGGPASDDPNDFDAQGLYRHCDRSPVSAMIFHGTDDEKIAIQDGRASKEYWRIKNGCAETSRGVSPEPCVVYDGCTTGNTVQWCEVGGFGHDVWRSTVDAVWTFVDSQKP